MRVRNNENTVPKVEEIKSIGPLTVKDIKPSPKENYSVTYERILLKDDFKLADLKDSNAILDIWLTSPTKPTPNIAPEVEQIKIIGDSVLRDLDTNVFVYSSNVSLEQKEPPKCFATVAQMGIEAQGPQEDLLYEKNHDWTPKLLQHTNFSIVQKELLVSTSPPYIGSVLTIPLIPGELGDLICNMYFVCDLPVNVNYTPRVGRALMSKVELYFNEFLIQQYDDYWSVIHDDLFMSADESLVLDSILAPPKVYIPLKFFFNEKNQYLPLCALYNQKVYIKIYFNDQTWFTDYPDPFDIRNPKLIFDQIFLTKEERTYMKLKSHEIAIPYIDKELPQSFTQGEVTLNMSANFNVSMLVWFIKNVNDDYTSRYSFGYVSPLVNSYTNFVNWKGETVNYIPVIDYVSLFINNINIVNGLTGDLYFTYKQPLEHGLSIPDKTMYVYCFSDEPKNPLKRGDLDFRTLASKTTNLKINFLKSLVPQLTQSYNLFLYYYGYKILSIDKGFGVLRA